MHGWISAFIVRPPRCIVAGLFLAVLVGSSNLASAEQLELVTRVYALSKTGDRALGSVMCGHPAGVSLDVPLVPPQVNEDLANVHLWTGRIGRPYFRNSYSSQLERLKWVLESNEGKLIQEESHLLISGETVSLDFLDFAEHPVPCPAPVQPEVAQQEGEAPLPVGFKIQLTPLGWSKFPDNIPQKLLDRYDVSTTVLVHGLYRSKGKSRLNLDVHRQVVSVYVDTPVGIDNLFHDLALVLNKDETKLGPTLRWIKEEFPQAEAVRVFFSLRVL